MEKGIEKEEKDLSLKQDEIIIKNEETTTDEELDVDVDDFVVEETTREDYIASCYYMLQSANEINAMTKADEKRKNRIIKRSLKVLDLYSKEIYDEHFENDDDDED
jgi:hypothetical protein